MRDVSRSTRLALSWRFRFPPNEDILNILDHCKIPYSVNSKSHQSYRIFLNTTRGKCAQQMSYGFKSLVKLGVRQKIFKNTAGRGFFENRPPTWRLPIVILSQILRFWQKKIKKPLKVPSLARSVPKPLKVPSLARSVPKPLKVPSLARSVPKPLKVPSLARSVPKPCVGEGGGLQTRHCHRCRPPTSWSSLREVREYDAEVMNEWIQNSCFKLAENRTANSL